MKADSEFEMRESMSLLNLLAMTLEMILTMLFSRLIVRKSFTNRFFSFLGCEHNVGVIEMMQVQFRVVEGFKDLNQISFDNFPIFLIKRDWESLRSRGFISL